MSESDRLLSPAVRKERKEEAARALRIKLGIGGGVVLLILVVALCFTVFSGKAKVPPPLTPESMTAQTLSSLDALIEEGNEILNDPKASSAAKAKWQKDRQVLEKQRKDILDKHPEWKK